MPYPSMPCWRATPKMALQGRWSVAVFYPFGHPTPYAYVFVLLCRIAAEFCVVTKNELASMMQKRRVPRSGRPR
jgi:hypothetical protein